MSAENEAILFNAVPLFVLAGAYLAVTAALLPSFWRERTRVHLADVALVLVFPCIAIPAAIFGAVVLYDGKPVGGNVWPPFAAILVALVPAMLFLFHWRERVGVVTGGPRARQAEELVSLRDRELEAVAAISNALARTQDTEAAARVLLDETEALFGVDFTALALIDEDAGKAIGVLARARRSDLAWWRDLRLDLRNEPSGIATAYFDATPLAVFDIETSPLVSPRLAQATGAKSGAFVPLIVDDRVVGVLVAATTAKRRAFTSEELTLMQTLAAEAALALERTRSAAALDQALARERLVAKISRRVRSVHDVNTVMRVAVAETGQALRASRCFIRIGEWGGPLPLAAEWFERGLKPIGTAAARLPASNLAARDRRTVAIEDVDIAPEFDDATIGIRETLIELGTRSVLATPIVVFDRMIGVLGLHRGQKGRWSTGDISLAEAVAREIGLAIRTAELLEESSRQARIERGFYRIASVLSHPISLAETLTAVAQAAAEALGGASAAVVMPMDEGLELVGSHQLPKKLAAFLQAGIEHTSPLGGAARSRRLLVASRLVGDERFDEGWQRVTNAYEYRSLLAVPVEALRDDDAGLVLVFFADERAFTDDDLELARTLAGAARGALERSELFESERSARALAQQLARTGSLFSTELDPAAVLDELVEQAPGLLGADACAIRLLEEDELVVSAAWGDGAEEALGSRAASTARLAGDVVHSRVPVSVGNVGEDRRLREADPLLAAGYSAYLGVPLVGSEGALHGVLAVYSRRPRAWREEEVEALAALSGNASAALASAELYQRVALEKERSVAILANIADGIVAVDRDGDVVLWNAAAERITGVPASEALGRTPQQVLQRNLESGETVPAGDRLVSIRRGSDEVWLSLTEAVMRDPAGAVAGRIFAFRDISSERVVEEMKSEFVSAVSQELRRPLTSIYGFAETLLRQDVVFGDEERRTFMGYIASEAERLTRIVDRLLNVARLDSGDLQVHLAPTDVRTVVSEVVTSAEQAAQVNGRRFELDLPAEPLDAEADREKLRQILGDLVDNAVKYSPHGGTVTIAARRKDERVEVRVIDEGGGVPAAERQLIFAKFHRGSSAAREGSPGGTGLGLFIAQRLVSAMGGRIWVDSAQGRGASFVFELPAAARD